MLINILFNVNSVHGVILMMDNLQDVTSGTHPEQRFICSFRINRIESPIVPWNGDCGESLTLYDAPRPDDARIIKTFCDTFSRPMEKHDFVSTGNAMFVRFESKTGSYSG